MPKAKSFNPKSLQNLSSIQSRITPEQRQAYGRKGGLIAAQNERKRQSLREIIANIGPKKLPKRKLSELAEKYGVDVDTIEGMSYDVAMAYAQYIKALGGDTDAARYIRDTSGQAPTQALQIGPLDAQSVDMSTMTDAEISAQIAALDAESGTIDGNPDGDSGD